MIINTQLRKKIVRACYTRTTFFIIYCSSVVNVMIKMIFSLIELKYRFSTPAAPERQRTPEDIASVPRPTHTAALAIPGERTGVAPELGERRFFKVGLPETANNH